MPDPLQLVRLKDCLYDTAFLPENLGSGSLVRMFQIPMGCYAGRKIKELEHTNMVMQGCLPAPEEFGIYDIRCGFYQGGEYLDPLPGKIELQQRLLTVARFPLAEIAAPGVRSLTHMRPHKPPAWENPNAVLTQLHAMEYFAVIVNLERKPDIPTELVVALVGDHYIFPEDVPTEMKKATE